jgi:hypothetical protein
MNKTQIEEQLRTICDYCQSEKNISGSPTCKKYPTQICDATHMLIQLSF